MPFLLQCVVCKKEVKVPANLGALQKERALCNKAGCLFTYKDILRVCNKNVKCDCKGNADYVYLGRDPLLSRTTVRIMKEAEKREETEKCATQQ